MIMVMCFSVCIYYYSIGSICENRCLFKVFGETLITSITFQKDAICLILFSDTQFIIGYLKLNPQEISFNHIQDLNSKFHSLEILDPSVN